MMILRSHARPVAALVAAALVAAVAPALTGCAPAIVIAGTQVAVSAVDRRSTGAQIDDQTIELKVVTTAASRWENDVHLNVTSFNGAVLLTGEAPTAQVRDEIMQLVKSTDRVRTVQNDMVIGPVADLGARSNDTYITSKVKVRFVEENRFNVIYVKVVTERSVVYLMGIVSREEGAAAAQIASTTSGVARVVKVFEYTN
jgi:osmotically-inducible protein OsmY